MQCNRCKREIDDFVHGRWSLPSGKGQETACVRCTRAAKRLADATPRGTVTLIDQDGNEFVLDMGDTGD